MYLHLQKNAPEKQPRSKNQKSRSLCTSEESFLLIMAIVVIAGGIFYSSKEDLSGTNQVIVYNWGEYLDPEVITLFEEETGINVVYEEFETNEIMYPKVQSGAIAYDVVCPSDYMIQRMIENDLLAELNFDNIPNAKNIGQEYLRSLDSFLPKTNIRCLTVGEQSEFYIIRQWLMNRLIVGVFSGTKNTKIIF